MLVPDPQALAARALDDDRHGRSSPALPGQSAPPPERLPRPPLIGTPGKGVPPLDASELSQWRLSPRGDPIATACGGEGGPALAPAGRGPLAGVQDRAGGEAGFGRAGRRARARGG